MADLCDHVAAVLHPLPTREQVSPPEAYDDAVEDTLALREQTAAALRAARDAADQPDEADLPDSDETGGDRADGAGGGGVVPWTAADPVLATIAGLRAQQRAADTAIRRLLAYAREFHRPAPYYLADLARAAEMSVSGVRTAYTDRDITLVTRGVKIQPRTSTR